nr:MAG TPA: hypothetical protein [Caudoviricetes sp.]
MILLHWGITTDQAIGGKPTSIGYWISRHSSSATSPGARPHSMWSSWTPRIPTSKRFTDTPNLSIALALHWLGV